MVSISNDTSPTIGDRILDAAAHCVVAYGVDRVTLAEIARRARVSRPTVYRRWPDVHGILSAMFTRRVISILRDAPGGASEREAIVDRSVAAVARLRHDPLVDEGKLYADRLTEAGVATEYACFEGTIHGFVSMAAVIPSGAQAMKLICDRIKGATQ